MVKGVPEQQIKKSLLMVPDNTISLIDDDDVVQTSKHDVLRPNIQDYPDNEDSDEDLFKGIQRSV